MTFEELKGKSEAELLGIIDSSGTPDPDDADSVRVSPALAAAIVLLQRRSELIESLLAGR